MPAIGFSVQSKMKQAGLAMRYVVTMALSCVLAVFGGLALDDWLNSAPLFALALLVYAVGSSLYMMIKKLGATGLAAG